MDVYPLYKDKRAPVELVKPRKCTDPVTCVYCECAHQQVMVADLECSHCESSDVSHKGAVLVLGGMPTTYEVDAQRPMSGSKSIAFRKLIESKCDVPIVYDNAVKCACVWRQTPSGKSKLVELTDAAIEQYRGYVVAVINEVEPSRIICLGKDSYNIVLGITTTPANCRGGYGYLSNETPVFMLSSPADVFDNRFLTEKMEAELDVALTSKPPLPPWEGEVRIVRNKTDVTNAINAMRGGFWTSYDTETSGPIYEDGHFRLVCLAATPKGSPHSYVWDREALVDPKLNQPLKDWLADDRCKKVAHNLKFDLQAAACGLDLLGDNNELLVKGAYGDTMIWAKQLDTEAGVGLAKADALVGMGGHKEENHSALVGARTQITQARALATKRGYLRNPLPGMHEPIIDSAIRFPDLEVDTFAYGLVEYEVLLRYCALDTVACDRLACLLEPKISNSPTHSFVWETFLKPATSAIAQVEAWGMCLSRSKLNLTIKLLTKDRATALAKVRGLGCEVDIGKDAQVIQYLYHDLKLKPVKFTDTGQPSVDAESLKTLAAKTKLPVLAAILTYKKVDKLLSNYGHGLLSLTRSTNRVHGRLNIMGARSGRMSSSNPNLQVIPSGPPYSKHIKGTFAPRRGYVLAQLDYSQLEYRVVCGLAGDKVMLEAFLAGEDLHMNTAKLIAGDAWGITEDEVTTEHRRQSKAVGFGTLYGQQPTTLGKNIGVPEEKAALIQTTLLGAWFRVCEFIEERKADAAKLGCTYTYWPDNNGCWRKARRRNLPDMGSSGKRLSTATNGSYNSPIQGTASDFMLSTVCAVTNWIINSKLDARVVNTVHDSIILEIRADIAAMVIDTVKVMMEGWPCGGVPLVADAEVGESWGALLPWNEIVKVGMAVRDKLDIKDIAKIAGISISGLIGNDVEKAVKPYMNMASTLGLC